MNASELEHIWKRQSSSEPTRETIAQITVTVCAVDRKFHRQIWWRDMREIGAAVSVAAVFGLVGQTWLRWISVLSCLFVAAYLVKIRATHRAVGKTPSVAERLQQMIRETETQIHLLRSVAWWYLLPGGVATVAFVLDRSLRKFSPSHLLLFFAAMIPFYAAIYWLNQRVVRKTLEPRRENLQKALAELGSVA